MKMNIYTALRNIYGAGEMLNLQPVAFDYVPENRRGEGSRCRIRTGR